MNNYSFDIYRNIALLLTKGIHISDVLHFMGVDAVYIYGIGEMGELVLSDLSGRMKVFAVFDRNTEKLGMKKIFGQMGEEQKSWYEYQVGSVCEIPDDDVVILITPASDYDAITDDLSKRGIDKRRFLSLNIVLYYGLYYLSTIISERQVVQQHKGEKEFLITGAQFGNKGAQNMLFIAISEIRKRYEDAVIWYLPYYWEEEYKDGWKKYRMMILPNSVEIDSTLYQVFPRLSGLIDISGTAWAVKGVLERNVVFFRMAYEYHVPVYLMPQSFGPDAFNADLSEELKKLLAYARIIYARERTGFDFLTHTLGLSNVKMSEDIVLQNTHLYKKYIFFDEEKESDYSLLTVHNVAVIPNTQNCRYGNQEAVYQLYKDIIRKLLHLRKEIYIISHSEDEVLCAEIYKDFLDNDAVHLYNKKFDCIGFRKLVKNFEYIVASRFHAIVNAYKEHIPCVVIGWLEKYEELAQKFQQCTYLFDVRRDIDVTEVILAIEHMEKFWPKESEKIASILPMLQKENCFDILNNI